MGIDLWNHSKFLHHKVRNMTRRGWLLKTYNDKKMLTARIKTGEKIENDKIDIIHPVGMVAHVKASGKHEVITMDVGGDTSRRVVLSVMGDREQHPQPDENEVFFYAPDDKKMFIRFKKERQQQGGGGGGQSRADDKDGSGNKDSGRPAGMHWDGKDQKVSGTTENTFANKADKGMGNTTKGNFDINASNATQFQAGKHLRKGPTVREGTMHVGGVVHAIDHKAGGSGSVSPISTFADGTSDDGSQNWGSSTQDGGVSLLETAAGLTQVAQQQQQNQQQQGQTNDAIMQKLAELEARIAALGG